MARGGSSRGRASRPAGKAGRSGASGARRRPGGTPRGATAGTPGKSGTRSPIVFDAPAAQPIAPGPFRLGAVAGATPGKWIDTWNERMPANPLEFVALSAADQRAALASGEVDAAIVRLPLDRDGLSVISLYDETTVAVCSIDSALTAVDRLELADLAGEVVIVPRDDVLGIDIPGAVVPVFAPPATTADAVQTVATGVGVVLVPMSLARLHHRKDVDFRPVTDAPLSTVALAWPTSATTPLVETFIGIVRGRTANSSR